MAFSGTLVAAGQANGIVVATGVHTQIGRISTLIQSVEVMATPLLTQIEQFARRFTWFVLGGGLALFVFAVVVRSSDWSDALIAIVAVAVVIVPGGLPAESGRAHSALQSIMRTSDAVLCLEQKT